MLMLSVRPVQERKKRRRKANRGGGANVLKPKGGQARMEERGNYRRIDFKNEGTRAASEFATPDGSSGSSGTLGKEALTGRRNSLDRCWRVPVKRVKSGKGPQE